MVSVSRLWILTLLACLALLVAWPLRWDEGPTVSHNQLKVVHFRDRWTGQYWYQLYGVTGGKIHCGEVFPHYSDKAVETVANQVLGDKRMVEGKEYNTALKDAKKSLTKAAYRNRNIATGIWATLLGISVIASIILFVRDHKQPK